MATAYTEEQVQLASIYSELKRVGESASSLYSMVDYADAATFNLEDGTKSSIEGSPAYDMAYSQALQRPSATACAYINEMQLRMIRARSRAFCMINPYWKAVRENKISYAVGTGHIYSINPRHKGKKVPDELQQKVNDELEQFCKLNKYRRRQGEKLTRLDRDGEYLLRFIDTKDDGVLRVRFIEPLLLQDPPGLGAVNNVWFGIQFDGIDYEEPIGYYIRPATYDGGLTDIMTAEWQTMIPASEIQHCTANVDIGSPRGLPTTYDLQSSLTQAVSTLKSMGRLVDVRARIALIRKQVNATLGQIQPLLMRNRSGQSQGPVQMQNVFRFPYGAVVDTNDQRTYEFPSQNIETDKIVHSLKADLQSVAAAVGLADFTISGDSSAAFANALVKEGPMDRAIGRIQQDLIDDDTEVYERVLVHAAAKGRLPSDILTTVRVDVMPPGVIARDRLVNTQADEILVRNGSMSPDTMAMRANLDPDDEREKAKTNPSPQVANALSGDKRSNQPGLNGKTNARGVPAGKEPGPANNKNTNKEGLEECSSDDRGQQPPSTEDLRVASTVITPEWLDATKRELLALPNTGRAIRDDATGEYEPGVPGMFLGSVDGQQVWGVDFDCMVVKYNAPDLVVGGNSEKWPFIPADKILIDWSNRITDVLHIALHELIEQKAMRDIGWNYARAHRLANNMPGGEIDFLLALRPELSAFTAK